MPRPWSAEEIQLVREQFPKFPARYIATQLRGRTTAAIYSVAEKYGISKQNRVRIVKPSPDRSSRWSDAFVNLEPRLAAGVRRCEACGHPTIPNEARAKLTPTQRRMFDIVHRSGTVGISSPDLMALVYQDRSDGGPSTSNVLRTQAAYMRPKLRPLGLTIRSNSGPGAIWRIETIGSKL
jgi:hypothetical protein